MLLILQHLVTLNDDSHHIVVNFGWKNRFGLCVELKAWIENFSRDVHELVAVQDLKLIRQPVAPKKSPNEGLVLGLGLCSHI